MGYYDDYIEHHGILGQKWGVRRFQNPDGTLTARGKARYGEKSDLYKAKQEAKQESKQAYKEAKKAYKEDYKKNLKETRKKASLGDKLMYNDVTRRKAAQLMTKYKDMSYEEATKESHRQALRNTGIVLAAYGAFTVATLYKMSH